MLKTRKFTTVPATGKAESEAAADRKFYVMAGLFYMIDAVGCRDARIERLRISGKYQPERSADDRQNKSHFNARRAAERVIGGADDFHFARAKTADGFQPAGSNHAQVVEGR